MKRKTVYICIVALVVLYAIFLFYNNSDSGQSQIEQKCLNSRDVFEQEVDQYNQTQKIHFSPAGTTYPAGDYLYHEKFYKVFYSQRLSTCVNVIISQTLQKNGSTNVIYEESYGMIDSSIGKTIDWLYTIKHGDPYYSIQDVDSKIADYVSSSSSPKSIIVGDMTVHQKCPDDYATNAIGTAEYNTDFDKWTNDFYNDYPEATVSDWSKARYQFWVDNNCVEALKRYNEAKNGTADNEKMTAIRTIVSEMIIGTSTQ